METVNKFDIFIDSLTQRFSSIPNFHLIQEEGPGKILFDFIVKSLADLNSVKSLFIGYYIPTALKAASDDLKEISNSKYKSLINISEQDLKENYHETVRLGYIAAYHKYEVFIKQLLINIELVFAEVSDNNTTLEKHIEKNFSFKIHNVWYSPNLHRINYICNCAKHFDGYPKKDYPPKAFENLSKDKKLEFTEHDLNKDIDFLINHYNSLLSTILFLASHKMLHERILGESNEILDSTDKEMILSQKQIVDDQAKQHITSLTWT